MSTRQKFRRLKASLLQQQVLNIHPPAVERINEQDLRGEFLAWQKLRAEYGDAGEPSGCRRLMVGSVAVLPILGVLVQKPSWFTRWGGGTSTEELEAEFKACLGDQRVTQIIGYFDTPGGTALGNEELWQTIFAARGKKPLVAFTRGMCCSAGYYLASAFPRIVGSSSSVSGSIGTIQVQMEYSKYLAEVGIKANVITHGENKGAGNPYEPLSTAARANLQKTVNDFGEMFVAAVARGRGVSPETVMQKFGQGAIFLPLEAQERGLIDAVANWDVLLGSLQSESSAAAPETKAPAASRLPLVAAAQQQITPESSNVAGASAAVSQQPVPPAAADARTKENYVNKKIKAVLLSRRFIDSIEADDELCKAMLDAWFSSKGKETPKDEDAILKQICAFSVQDNAAAPAPSTAPKAAQNVVDAHEREMEEARVAGVQAGEKRILDIQARGKLLNISQEQIDLAISSKKPLGDILADWTAVKAKEEPPVAAAVKITGEGSDAWQADALTGLQLRLGMKVDEKQVNAHSRQMRHAPLWALALQSLRMSNTRISNEYDREEIVTQALAVDPHRTRIDAQDGGPVNRPANFPNLLSALVNKTMDEGMDLAEVTYDKYCGKRASDLPDFKPAPVVAKSQHDELDEVLDAEAFKEFGLAEECLAYMQLARYGNKFGATPVMLANDDLDAFQEGALGLTDASENTLNRLCLKQLAGNVTLLDTVALFHSTHANVVTSGSTPAAAAPSDAQWQGMLNLTYAQRPVGAKGYIRGKLGIALIPPQLERAAVQTFVKSYESERKSATADSSINIYRGQVDVVIEAELQNYSAAIWYGLMRPRGTRNATVIYSYFSGWGRAGKRERWYDPNTKCFYVSLESRFGAAAKQYRTAVRNDGA